MPLEVAVFLVPIQSNVKGTLKGNTKTGQNDRLALPDHKSVIFTENRALAFHRVTGHLPSKYKESSAASVAKNEKRVVIKTAQNRGKERLDANISVESSALHSVH